MIKKTLMNNARGLIHKQKILPLFCSIILLSGVLFFSCTKNKEVDLSQSSSAGSLVQSEKDTSYDLALPEERKQLSPDLQNDIIETSISFLGWKGEEAIIRQEDLLEDGQIRTLYFVVKADGRRQQLDYRKWQDENHVEFSIEPPDIEDGKVLVSDSWTKAEFPIVLLSVDADPKEVNEIVEAITKWDPEMGIPKAKAKLRIHLLTSAESTMLTLWEKPVELKPLFGETQLEYNPPSINSAILSPGESFLYVEITYSGESEYIVISIPPKTLERK